MDANIEKYRGLSEIVKNYVDRDLFGPMGLFGDPENNPRPFELFRKWLLKVTRVDKNQIEHNSINAQKFIKFLQDTQEKDENNELIKNIEALHADNVIEDRTPDKNTLLDFAKVINSLGIVSDEANFLNNYRVALRTARLLEPLKEESAKKEVSKTEANKPVISGIQKNNEVKAKQETGSATERSISNESATAVGSSETQSGDEELKMKMETTTAEETTYENKDTEDKKEPAIQKVQPVNTIATPTNAEKLEIKNTGIEGLEFEIPKAEPKKIPTETEFKEESKISEERGGTDRVLETSEITTSYAFNRPISAPRIIRRVNGANGQVMRSAKSDRVLRRVEDTKNPQGAPQNKLARSQNEQEAQQSYDYQSESARRQQLAQSQQERPKKKGLAGKLIRRGAAAAVIGGGTFFGFIVNSGDTTANAATFKSIISFIHLFLK